MTPTFLDCVLRGAEALAARDAVGTLPDPDLVRRFAAERDPAAFAVLVRRHGPLVWGVCRNLLPRDADAEDAFQATFLALVRSAGSVRRAEALGAWLHGVAYRVAMKTRRAAARRRQREQVAAVAEPDCPVPDTAWDELQAAVHEEVCRLPEKLRLPFVLCGLQGRQQKDAARQLGWKVGTLSARLTQARQRLLDRLARRGVPVGVAAGAAVLGMASGTAAVPNSVCLKALAAAKDQAAVSPVVLSLARGVTSMSLTRTKLLAVAVLVAGALTTGVGSRFLSTADAQPAPPASSDATADQVKRALDYLGSVPARDRWEYKFIPVEKALAKADLEKVLGTADREGWTYCGSQDVAVPPEGKGSPRPIPHMVFKRPRPGARAADESNTAAGLLALALAQQQKAAQDAADAEAKARKQAEAQNKAKTAADYDRTLRSAMESESAKNIYASQIEAAKKALDQERAKSAELERMLNALRAQQEDFLQRMRALEAEKGANRRSELEPRADRTGLTLPRNRVDIGGFRKALEKLAPAAAWKVTEDEAANTVTVHGPPELLAKVRELVTKEDPASAGKGAAAAPVTARIPLTHVEGLTAAKDLARLMPGHNIVAEVGPKYIVLTGPAEVIKTAQQQIEKQIDVKPADPTGMDVVPLTTIKLKAANADEVQAILAKVYEQKGRFVAHTASNSLVVTAPPAVLAEVKKLVEALDVPGRKR